MCRFDKLPALITAYFLACFALFGQGFEHRISRITDERGKDPGATFAIAEDQRGFIWFGTVDGLYRYDGYNFKTFRNDKNNPNSLAWNTIRALTISPDNKLWIGTQGAGLDCFDLSTEKFTHYPPSVNDFQGPSGADIWALHTDRNGNIWIGAVGYRIDMFDRKENIFKHFRVLPDDLNPEDEITIQSIFEDSSGLIWVGMNTYGLSSINVATGEVVNYRNIPGNSNSIPTNEVYHIFEDSQKNIVVCTYGGGFSFLNKSTGIFTTFRENKRIPGGLVSNLVRVGISMQDKEYWFGTEYGITIFNSIEKSFINYQQKKLLPNSLSDNRIRAIFKDSRGIVWVGNESGVNKIIDQRNFIIFRNDPSDSESFPEGIVRTILQDNENNLWFGIIDNGLVKYNPANRSFTRFLPGSKPGSISGHHVTSLFQDSNNIIWIGEWDTGLSRFDPKKKSFTLEAGTSGTKIILPDTRIQFIKEAEPGVLWIGTEGGLSRYDYLKQSISHLRKDPQNKNSLSGNGLQSNAFVQDKQGNLWLGTWSEGLNRIEFSDKHQSQANFNNWKYDPKKPKGINNNNIISLHLSGDFLWIGTFGGGLNRMNLKTEEFKHYTTDDGLPNNIVFAILEDENNNLWLSTDNGLSMFDPIKEVFLNYTKSDGLQDDHFFWGSSFKSQSGEFYFGGINGVNSFFPSNISRNIQPPVPVIVDLRVFEKSIESDIPVSELTQFVLPYNENYITFEYIGLDYYDPAQVNFMLKLEGLDEDWVSVGSRRIASYSGMAPDKYKFRLRAINKDGIWSDEELVISFRILPPWWQTWIARSLLFIFIVGMLITIYYLRVGYLENLTRKLELTVNQRTKEINLQKEELETINENLVEQKEQLTGTLKKLKRTQNQLVESEKMASLGVLTAGVAHEINNPLNYIQAGLYGITDYIEANPECFKNCDNKEEIEILIDRMQNGVNRVSGIVASLNHFNRQSQDTKQVCDIHAIINNCLLMLNNHIQFNIDIEKNFTTEPIQVKGNEGKLHQVFINIIANATDAIHDKGIIRISTFLDNNFLCVSVKDNGSGIKKEIINKIMDPFFTTKDAGSGVGLGLSISYGIIKEHKGDIEINSIEGEGTEVLIYLPVK